MAMLAEPRRKQKWSVDPRNTAWSKDESKFGQKMLEKMGWSKGKGLGAQEQGDTEHVKVRVKNNTLGLGAPSSHADDWLAHQEDFNQLLAELNTCHGQDAPEPVPMEQKTTFSLEEKSKTSRKRVHYVKFAKGKDLSSRSEDDLSCIFGKRRNGKKKLVGAGSSLEEDTKEEDVPSDHEAVTHTVTSPLSVQEYFAKRMAQLKKVPIGAKSAEPAPTVEESPECLGSRAKKRKNKTLFACEDGCEASEVKSPRILGPSRGGTDELSAPKKKKKSKHPDVGDGFISEASQHGVREQESCCSGISETERDDLEEKTVKRKHKKKQQKQDKETAEESSRKKKKKKKHSG